MYESDGPRTRPLSARFRNSRWQVNHDLSGPTQLGCWIEHHALSIDGTMLAVTTILLDDGGFSLGLFRETPGGQPVYLTSWTGEGDVALQHLLDMIDRGARHYARFSMN